MDSVDAIAALFEREGAREYLGEAVSLSAHMLQAATLAERAAAPDHLIAAALLHDVGHLQTLASRGPGTRQALPEVADSFSAAFLGANSDKKFSRPQFVRETGLSAELRAPHEESGAVWLAGWFPEEVTEPVRLHVAAKRYLCATEADYVASLSPASLESLAVQGGAMSTSAARAFERLPHASAAVALRRWDEAAKDPSAPTFGFDHFRPLLARVRCVARE
jgi:gamma-butyrobetaine dioxygenase